jgi:hypothetical protein
MMMMIMTNMMIVMLLSVFAQLVFFSIISHIHRISKDCHGISKWSKMLNERIFYGPNDEEWGQDTKYVYTCPECVASNRGITLQEAILVISEAANRHNSTRSARFKESQEAKRSEFEGMTHEGLRKVTLEDLNHMFYPLIDLLIKKIDQMMSLQVHMDKVHGLQDRLKKAVNVTEAKQIE